MNVMKKLNNDEINEVVNEIVKNVKELKIKELKEVLEVDSNYKEIVSLYDEKYKLKLRKIELNKRIKEVNELINKDFKVKIYNRTNSNSSSNYLSDELRINFDYEDEEIFSYYNVRSKVILSNINGEVDVNEFIKKFVEELNK
jgi:hypothetical protein